MSKSNCGNNMTGGVAVCYWPLLVENEIAMFPLNARNFCPGLIQLHETSVAIEACMIGSRHKRMQQLQRLSMRHGNHLWSICPLQ